MFILPDFPTGRLSRYPASITVAVPLDTRRRVRQAAEATHIPPADWLRQAIERAAAETLAQAQAQASVAPTVVGA